MKKRKIYNSIKNKFDGKHFIILTGPRQCGKTTVLKQLYEHRKKENLPAAWVNFENPTIVKAANEHPDNILHMFAFQQQSLENERLFLFIDEVQYLDNPSNFLKYLFDEYNTQLKIIATGSSAFYIDTKFKDSLVGRKRLFEIGTLDFREYLHFTDNDALIKELNLIQVDPKYISLKKKKLYKHLDIYLTFGGYPEIVLTPQPDDKKILLDEVLSSAIKKDFFEASLQNDAKYFAFLTAMAQNSSNLYNENNYSKSLKISRTPLNNFLHLSRKAFLIDLLTPFYRNIKKELSKMPKCYFLDSGLRNFLLNDFRPVTNRADKGQVLENYVYRLFWDKYKTRQLHYWRTADQNEVDFILEENRETGTAYEVKWNSDTPFNKGQHKFQKAYPNFPLKKLCWENARDEKNEIEILKLI